MNGTRVILDPSSLSSVGNLVPSNVPTISPNTSANAAATAAAIALTNLQNKVELHQVAATTAVPIQTMHQPTVIVQAPNSTVADSGLPRVVLCSSMGGKPVALTPIVSFPKSEPPQSINSTTTDVSSSISSANLISRPIDLLTSAALAAAAVNNENVSTSLSATCPSSSKVELNPLTVISNPSVSLSHNEASNIVDTNSSRTLPPNTSSNDKSIAYNLSKYDFLVHSSNAVASVAADSTAKRLLPDCNANLECEDERTKKMKTELN